MMNRNSKLKELIQRDGISFEKIAKEVFLAEDDKAVSEAMGKIERILDYRDLSKSDLDNMVKIVNLTTASDEEKKYITAQARMYLKNYKAELDKKFDEHIKSIQKKADEEIAKYWAEVADPEVENLINNEITFDKAVEWMKAEEAKKAEKPKKEKKAKKDATVVETADSPVETVEGIEENPFDTL